MLLSGSYINALLLQILAETLARARKCGFDRADGKGIVGGDLGYRAVIPIAAHENYSRICVKRAQKAIYRLAQCYVVCALGHRARVGEHFAHLIENRRKGRVTLLSLLISEAVEREISRYSAEIRRKCDRFLGRHSIPRAQIGVVDAFLALGLGIENIVRNSIAVFAVFSVGLGDRI